MTPMMEKDKTPVTPEAATTKHAPASPTTSTTRDNNLEKDQINN